MSQEQELLARGAELMADLEQSAGQTAHGALA